MSTNAATLPEVPMAQLRVPLPLGDEYIEQVDVLLAEVDDGLYELAATAEELEENWMAEVDAVVEAEAAARADEIAAEVVADLAGEPPLLAAWPETDEPEELEEDTEPEDLVATVVPEDVKEVFAAMGERLRARQPSPFPRDEDDQEEVR